MHDAKIKAVAATFATTIPAEIIKLAIIQSLLLVHDAKVGVHFDNSCQRLEGCVFVQKKVENFANSPPSILNCRLVSYLAEELNTHQTYLLLGVFAAELVDSFVE